jgi:hypothetical protein
VQNHFKPVFIIWGTVLLLQLSTGLWWCAAFVHVVEVRNLRYREG